MLFLEDSQSILDFHNSPELKFVVICSKPFDVYSLSIRQRVGVSYSWVSQYNKIMLKGCIPRDRIQGGFTEEIDKYFPFIPRIPHGNSSQILFLTYPTPSNTK
jgi:hypothetical protein